MAASPATEGHGEPALLAAARAVVVRLGGRLVLDDVDIEVRSGEIATVIGPNGSGKTTLARTLLGLVRPASGTVTAKPGVRIGYAPQHVHVDPTLPLTVRRFMAMGGVADRARIDGALAEAGVGYLANEQFHELSGGEAKRVLLGRALLRDPDLLVLDEPTASIDVAGQAEFYSLLRTMRDDRGCGVLLISHDLHLVMAATDFVTCLNGHVCCRGRPEAVARDPAYLALFGPRVAETLSIYAHSHDHRHDLYTGSPTDAEDGNG